MKAESKQTILIADDSEMNRSILADMLGEEFEIFEAADGREAVKILEQMEESVSLVLLDIVMPYMDGYEVLEVMTRRRWLENIPVIMISAESRSSYIEKAYELGVTDFISRPFDALIVRRRVLNTLMLYAKQKKLIGMVADQIHEKEKSQDLMIGILSHIVEFRNGESGLHVLHIRTITEMLLKHLTQITDRYSLGEDEIVLIGQASALHDIGKIAIDDKILNKPGRLTEEEYEVMKTHTTAGAAMLKELPFHQEEPLVRTAYEICRWHHERYDGRGYPDGLEGDQIPLSAQIVSLADVYDALTSRRVYKEAYTHEKALEMIGCGDCGAFSPLLIRCLLEIGDHIQEELNAATLSERNTGKLMNIIEDRIRYADLEVSNRSLELLENERTKYDSLAVMSGEVQFEYTNTPPMVIFTEKGAALLKLKEIIENPREDPAVLACISAERMKDLQNAVRNTTPERPMVRYECPLWIDGKERWHRIICRSTWSPEENPKCTGIIGKITDIHEEYLQWEDLQYKATHDSLTGLWNHEYANRTIRKYLQEMPAKQYALMIVDLDLFKGANDRYGHIFGDQVLRYVAKKLLRSIRSTDLGARVGGDEFMIFLEYKEELQKIVERIFHMLNGEYRGFPISVTMGISCTKSEKIDYDTLFHQADKALYAAKRSGRGKYCFYDDSMEHMLSVLSPIEHGKGLEEGD